MNIEQKVAQIYLDYKNRNLTGALDKLPDDFCFEWPFDSKFARYAGVCKNKKEFLSQLEELAVHFEFNNYSASNIIVEGNRAAAQVDLNMTSKKTGDRFDATIAHFWTFENNEPVRLVEYMDTALMKHQSG